MNMIFPPIHRLGIRLLASLLFLLLSGSVHAQGMMIEVQKQGLEPMPIAIPSFASVGLNGHVEVGDRFSHQLTGLVISDLSGSGLFRPLEQRGFLQPSDKLWQQGPDFRKWRLVGADAVVQGAITYRGSRIQVDFFLHDISRGTLIGKGWRFTTKPENWRHVAHRVADEIYTRLTGERAYFTSRIAFVAKRDKQSFLSMMDADGANRMDLKVKGRNDLVLTPRFSPNGEQLLYISYESSEPRIYLWDLYTGKRVKRSNYPGLNSTPAWSPDGNRMALTLSKDGNSEIYVIDMRNQSLQRLTYNAAIDTSPSWSPDGRRMVFTSDRAGTPQLYIMDADGSDVRRLTQRGQSSTAPSWSNRGDKIAFVRGGGGKFRIAVIDPTGRDEQLLTDSWMDESPTWSPNGRVILFSRQQQGSSRTRLFTIDITGFNEQEVPLEQDISASDPSWSPVIK
ncbi:TolB, N-terminal domain protein [Magnetococcus marinus MC-1]|uniref:Tol-Pal system protein TolB n=1 Tax=Magnetococcus marinus (strain ATCC BAA-1437 / JCM 17883 / MC-1) TaxID=156889 RepID=A0L4U9_MAGMM|nr:Tol-Pal system beta propeller repeat protein TolB [Magnetococcus marinus]ABK42992.1 TolB, N-terminal domain protein [Magnetococcus marinus MC-1]